MLCVGYTRGNILLTSAFLSPSHTSLFPPSDLSPCSILIGGSRYIKEVNGKGDVGGGSREEEEKNHITAQPASVNT